MTDVRRSRNPGQKVDITVFAAESLFANNPQVVRTDREVVLCYGVQEIDKLRAIKIHHHYHPCSKTVWSVSEDGGFTWCTMDRAPSVGHVQDSSYGAPLLHGGMVTITFQTSPLTPLALIQQDQVGCRPYTSDLPAVEAAPVRDLGPFRGFWFHSLTRTSDHALLAAGYAEAGPEWNGWTVLFLRSTDEGRSWRYLSHIPRPSPMSFSEPGVLAGEGGHVLALLRADWDKVPRDQRPSEACEGYGYFLYQAESWDCGRTWSEPVQLPVWGHPPHLLRLHSGAILLVYGHRRPPHSVRAILSYDEGRTWDPKTMRTLRTWKPGNYDLGYPQATQLTDGTILCAYYGYTSQAVEGVLNPCGIYVSLFDEQWLQA